MFSIGKFALVLFLAQLACGLSQDRTSPQPSSLHIESQSPLQSPLQEQPQPVDSPMPEATAADGLQVSAATPVSEFLSSDPNVSSPTPAPALAPAPAAPEPAPAPAPAPAPDAYISRSPTPAHSIIGSTTDATVDCQGELGLNNPDCYPWFNGSAGTADTGGSTGSTGSSPAPSPSPASPIINSPSPPPPCMNPNPSPAPGVYLVMVNNLVATNTQCSAAGQRSIRVSVIASVVTLPGVDRTSVTADVTCVPGSGKQGAKYLVTIKYQGTNEAQIWLNTATDRISPCALWLLACAAFCISTKTDTLSDSKFCKGCTDMGCSGCSSTKASCPSPRPSPPSPPLPSPTPPPQCPPCNCTLNCTKPPSPPPPSPPPPPPPPPAAVQCNDYTSISASNLVVWGDDRTQNPTFISNPSGTGTCAQNALSLVFSPVQSTCTQKTSLAVETSGIVFMNCFTYDVLSQNPILGPAVEIEPSGFNGSLRIQSVHFELVSNVDDCTQALALNVQNSQGQTTTLGLPCMPNPAIPYDMPSDVAALYTGAKGRLFFTGMSAQHVLSIKRIYYQMTIGA